MGGTVLVNEQLDAGREFVVQFDEYNPVSVAFWIVPTESDIPVLYVASDNIDDSNFDIAYGEVFRLASQQNSMWLDPFQIKILNTSEEIALEAIKVRDRFTAPLITHFGGSYLGGKSVKEAHIYPSLPALKALHTPN